MGDVNVLVAACGALSEGNTQRAEAILNDGWPFERKERIGTRSYSPLTRMKVFLRDGFIDQYSGRRLMNPAALRALSIEVPEQLPYHPNWHADRCHFAYYELSATIDHVMAVSSGGGDDEDNLVTTSMLKNAAKSNFPLEEPSESPRRKGDWRVWDGQTQWFLNEYDRREKWKNVPYLRWWARASRAALESLK